MWHQKNSLPYSCPLLDVNEEVRMISEMYYSRSPEAHPDIIAKSFAYISFDVDILWVDGEFALKNFMSGEPRYGELRRPAFPYQEWLDGRCYWDFPGPELVILNMQLDELMFVVDWEEHIETGTAQVFELGPNTWVPRRILQEGVSIRDKCKIWEDLRLLKVDRLEEVREDQQIGYEQLLQGNHIFLTRNNATPPGHPCWPYLSADNIVITEELRGMRLKELSTWKTLKIKFVQIRRGGTAQKVGKRFVK
jgi:hypothetical protein